MKQSIRINVPCIAVVAATFWLSSPSASSAPIPVPAKPEAKNQHVDDRDEIANKLLERVTLKDPLKNTPLSEVIEFLSDKYEINVIVDAKSFGGGPNMGVALNANEDEAFMKQPINVPALKNVRLGTILKIVADQIEGVYLIQPDHIQIVSPARAFTLTNPPLKVNLRDEDEPAEDNNKLIRATAFVTANYGERPLQDALKDIEVRTSRTIVLANQAAEKGKTPVTARLTNVPVDTAVSTLAEMAGLKLIRKGNVLLVTTPERYKELETLPPVFPSGYGPPMDPRVDELKKKIEELEKQVEAFKKK
ncbi:MAG: hypothetical protein K8T89_10475 [Planctomycetes bacterium]|nr:hypothetical protein [Planctomycetota bacterium]